MPNGTDDEDAAEIASLKADVRRIEAALSEGYVRGKLRRRNAGAP